MSPTFVITSAFNVLYCSVVAFRRSRVKYRLLIMSHALNLYAEKKIETMTLNLSDVLCTLVDLINKHRKGILSSLMKCEKVSWSQYFLFSFIFLFHARGLLFSSLFTLTNFIKFHGIVAFTDLRRCLLNTKVFAPG